MLGVIPSVAHMRSSLPAGDKAQSCVGKQSSLTFIHLLQV